MISIAAPIQASAVVNQGTRLSSQSSGPIPSPYESEVWAVGIITLDHDFGQVLRFPPERGAGLVILEPGPRATPRSLLDRLQDFLAMAEVRSPRGCLWIVEPGRVRIHLRAEG